MKFNIQNMVSIEMHLFLFFVELNVYAYAPDKTIYISLLKTTNFFSIILQ